MKKLIFLSFAILFSITIIQAQATIHQLGSKKAAAKFAEAPQEILGDLQQLRGFGVFMKVDKSNKKYDNLVRFYEVGKEKEGFIMFLVTANLVNSKGKVVGKSNTMKIKMRPNKETQLGKLAFPGDLFEALPKGRYELTLEARPAKEELLEMFKMDKPNTRFIFKK